ncbi:MAG: hypothetical protein LBS20_02035 [Prevotella sp.]|uniref:Uncharacterized protein n=1 Tax=Dysgonomonas termitidis TaxID=1516126 RepID=A0ABV9L0V7_9BACT|nr:MULTISPECIES: hypothetical protein [unclassified Dysgonomonas]MDR1714601.1 hypothetical protein [Prevotella sp.]MDR2003896.1 hypothetical protein [Prevotella sp.]
MKEFKFWAIPYPIKQILLMAAPIWILYIPVFFCLGIEHIHYFIFGTWALAICFVLIFVRRVKISFTPANEINIFFNGKLKYSGSPVNLEYVRGANIADGRSNTVLYFSFSDKKFMFNILENRNSFTSGTTKQVELLRYMVTVFNLRTEYYKDSMQGRIFTYWNPIYKESLRPKEYNKSER